MAEQSALLTVLPQGVWMLRGFLPRAEQKRLRDELRAVSEAAPFFRPSTPFDVTRRRYVVSSAGEYGWVLDGGGNYYTRNHPQGVPWPEIPEGLLEAAQRAAAEAGFLDYSFNSCTVAYYKSGGGSREGQRDDAKGEDLEAPAVTVALGDTAELGIGGPDPKCVYQRVEFKSGDVLVMGGPGRQLYHSLTGVAAGTDLLPRGGHLSATLRRALFAWRV